MPYRVGSFALIRTALYPTKNYLPTRRPAVYLMVQRLMRKEGVGFRNRVGEKLFVIQPMV